MLIRLARWKRRRQFDRDLADEIETHRTLRQARLEESGLSPREAEHASRRALGNITLAREDAREVWVVRWLEDIARDLRHAGRLLRRSPGFTLVVVASLALGIGGNTAIFSVIDAVVLKTLPVDTPERLVVLERVNTRGERSNLSYALFEALRAPDTFLSGTLAALDGTYRLDMSEPDAKSAAGPDVARVQAVSGEYFQVLGVGATGTSLTRDDDVPRRPERVGAVSQVRRAADLAPPSTAGRRLILKRRCRRRRRARVVLRRIVGQKRPVGAARCARVRSSHPLERPDGLLGALARLRPGDPDQAKLALTPESPLSGLPIRSVRACATFAQIAVTPGSRGSRTRGRREPALILLAVASSCCSSRANVATLLLVRETPPAHRRRRPHPVGGTGPACAVDRSALLRMIGGAVALIAGWGVTGQCSLDGLDSAAHCPP